MKISVVIPAFNEEKMIRHSIRAINEAARVFAHRAWQYEIVVCDNNSSDQTSTLARAEGANVVFEPVNQISRARNTGASAATGDWLLFVDADSFPSPELFDDMANHIHQGECIAGGVIVKLDGGGGMIRLAVRGWNFLSRWNRWMAGSFIFCETAVFRELGGFSQELFAAEELDLSKRLHRVARARNRRVIILHRHPLLTSARKSHLYTPWEHLKFISRTVLRGGKSLRKRDECVLWYDGRR